MSIRTLGDLLVPVYRTQMLKGLPRSTRLNVWTGTEEKSDWTILLSSSDRHTFHLIRLADLETGEHIAAAMRRLREDHFRHLAVVTALAGYAGRPDLWT